MIESLLEDLMTLKDQSEKTGDLVTMLGMMAHHQSNQRQMIGNLHNEIKSIVEMVSAPKEIIQDPKTGRKIVRRANDG